MTDNVPQSAAHAVSPRNSGRLFPLLIGLLALFLLARLGLYLRQEGLVSSKLHDPNFFHWLAQLAIAASVLALITTTLAAFAGFALSRASMRRLAHASDVPMFSALFGGSLMLFSLAAGVLSLGDINPEVGFLLLFGLLALPFSIWRLKLAADGVSTAMLDAARVDGCSPFASFRLIVLPLIARALIVTAIFCFVIAWNVRTMETGDPSGRALALLLSIPFLFIFLTLVRRSAPAGIS